MLFTANQDAFSALLAQGLIDDAQHDALLADPATATLPPIPTPAHALAWMLARSSASGETKEALLLRVHQKLEADELDNDGADEAETTALDAFELLELGERGITREAVLSLHDTGRIDGETRDKALGKAPLIGTAPPAPEATLAWLFPDHFAALLAQRLVTQAQLDAARAHPEFALLPTVPRTEHALAWMWLRGIAPKEDSDAVVERLTRDQVDADTIADAEDTAMDAEELLDLGERGVTRDAVLALFNDGLLDAESRDNAFDWVPLLGSVPPEPAATLAWLVTDGPIEEAVFEATATRAKAEPAFALAADRMRIVDEARQLIAEDHSAIADVARAAHRRSGGRTWFAWLATAGVIGGIGWFLLAPAAVPACDAASTRKTLDGLSLRLGIDARVRNSMSPGARDADALPRISEMRQVGYRKAERLRGCLATIALGDDKETMAYTVGPTEPKSNDMIVRGADPAIVEARFGHLDADGKPLYSTAPIGREALEQAVRDAAEQLFPSKASAMVDRLRALGGGGTGLVSTDPDRERTVPDLELTGACRAADGGTGHICPLVIEYNDRLLGALSGGGGRSIAVHGEFSFVQDGGRWRASNEFANTFMRAVVTSRLTQLGVNGGDSKP